MYYPESTVFISPDLVDISLDKQMSSDQAIHFLFGQWKSTFRKHPTETNILLTFAKQLFLSGIYVYSYALHGGVTHLDAVTKAHASEVHHLLHYTYMLRHDLADCSPDKLFRIGNMQI